MPDPVQNDLQQGVQGAVTSMEQTSGLFGLVLLAVTAWLLLGNRR